MPVSVPVSFAATSCRSVGLTMWQRSNALRTAGTTGPVAVDMESVKSYDSPTCGRNSVAECQLPKLDVAGSNPVGRSKNSGGYGEVAVTPVAFLPIFLPMRSPGLLFPAGL